MIVGAGEGLYDGDGVGLGVGMGEGLGVGLYDTVGAVSYTHLTLPTILLV